LRAEAAKRLPNCVLKNTTRHVVAGSPTSSPICHYAATMNEWHRDARILGLSTAREGSKGNSIETDITFRSILLLRSPSRLSPGWGFCREGWDQQRLSRAPPQRVGFTSMNGHAPIRCAISLVRFALQSRHPP